jgi:hypothetical protein
MNDRRFDELLERLRDDYNQPSATPREAMWSRIEAAQRARAARGRWRPRHFYWPLAAAALVLLGIGIGRGLRPATPLPHANDSAQPPLRVDPYALVAARHLDRAEALLTHFESGAAAKISQAQLARWSRELLEDTRLLLDSPAVDQPTMRSLLADVELLLALIVQTDLSDDPRAIADGLRNSGLLERLRARIPAETI